MFQAEVKSTSDPMGATHILGFILALDIWEKRKGKIDFTMEGLDFQHCTMSTYL